MMEGDIFRIVTMRCSDYCPDYLFVLAAAALKNCSRLEWIGMMQCNKLKRYFLIDPSCCTFSTSNFWWYLAWPGLAWYWLHAAFNTGIKLSLSTHHVHEVQKLMSMLSKTMPNISKSFSFRNIINLSCHRLNIVSHVLTTYDMS